MSKGSSHQEHIQLKYVCTQQQVFQIHKASIVYKGKDRY